MTIKEAIGILLILVAAFLFWRLTKKVNKMRAQEEQILDDEFQKVKNELKSSKQLITPSLLEQYGFKIHDTKDVIYAVNGSISMTLKDGYWETEIQAPGKILWRDTHIYLGQLLYFCEKHDFELIKQEDNDHG